MNDFGTAFSILVGLPAVLFAIVAATQHELADVARRSLVTYAALLMAAFGGLLSVALGNPAILLAALVFAYGCNLASGPVSLGLSLFGLVVITILATTQGAGFSIWGVILAMAASAFGLMLEIRRSA